MQFKISSMLLLESPHNERFKKLLKLSNDNKFRRQQKLFIVEGLKEIRVALEHHYQIQEVYIDQKYITAYPEKEFEEIPATALKHDLFTKLVYREDASYMLAVMKEPELSLDKIKLPKNPLIVILENVEKPGNLGAILRTCDAVGADAVILSQEHHNFFHPNVIRSSVGTVFSNQIAFADGASIKNWCEKNKIKVYAAALQTDSFYTNVDYSGGTAFVMGAEDTGLNEFWREAADQIIKIPMLGYNDSLNVSVSAAVLLYEARRQREL